MASSPQTTTLSLNDPLTAVPHAQRGVAAALAKPPFGLHTVADLAWYLPRDYKDLGRVQPVSGLEQGQQATVIGRLVRWDRVPVRKRGLTMQKALVRDDDGSRITASFFNQPWLPGQHTEGGRVAISGTVSIYRGDLQLKGPKIAAVDDQTTPDDMDADSMIPVYKATDKVTSPKIARFVELALDALPDIPDHLPQPLLTAHRLMPLDEALRTIHRPSDPADLAEARRRLIYNELLLLQLTLQGRRLMLERDAVGMSHPPVSDGVVDAFLQSLPFAPTIDQQQAFADIDVDLGAERPMHRLLQGDVGAGKTIVAAYALLRAVDNGRQGVLMAPTTVLAEQHLTTFRELLRDTVIPRLGRPPRVQLLSSSMTKKLKAKVLSEVVAGECDILIGTHAVLEDNVTFAELGVVVIDEQHRFGVEHRTALAGKAPGDTSPDVLVMTATPIPRSLALTMYGDLDVTVMRERPGKDRITVTTQIIPTDSERRARLYDFVRDEIAAGRRAYVVCPLIDPSEADVLADVASAVEVHAALSTNEFADINVGLMHGRMPADERDRVMADFRSGEVPLLVATTVIEVGVSVDESSVMIIEDADRFGISQLHQLRGRLYRGHPANYCVLFSRSTEGNPRLDALSRTEDGFELAEIDLRLRKEGKVFDTAQTGESDLRIASLIADVDIVARTRDDARRLLIEDPGLMHHPELAAEVARWNDPRDLEVLEGG